MAREILAGTFLDGSDVLVDVVNDRLHLAIDPEALSPPSSSAPTTSAILQ
jgi:hypothetical protein